MLRTNFISDLSYEIFTGPLIKFFCSNSNSRGCILTVEQTGIPSVIPTAASKILWKIKNQKLMLWNSSKSLDMSSYQESYWEISDHIKFSNSISTVKSMCLYAKAMQTEVHVQVSFSSKERISSKNHRDQCHSA